ncbi:MAG: hypothetical protein AAF849_02940 [Bacteroidota bacterium]
MNGIYKFIQETLLHGVLFLVLVILASIALYKLSGDTDRYFDEYEIAGVRAKKEVFDQHQEEYNTVFVGSSRTYNQINPQVFDSITGLQSFNLAYSAVQPFRIFDYLKEIARTRPDLDYVFVEMSPLPRLYASFKGAEQLHAVDERRYPMAVDFFRKNDLPVRFQFQSIKDYTKLMAYKYIGFNSAKRWRAVLSIPEPREGFPDRNVYETGGFFPTDSVTNNNAPLRKRQRYFQQHPEEMEKYDYSTQKSDFSKDRDRFVEEWLAATEYFSEETSVILLIPPRNPWNSIKQTTKLKHFLLKENVIIFDFSSSDEYPDLYSYENSNDEVHLNLKGANLYTTEVAKKFQANFSNKN